MSDIEILQKAIEKAKANGWHQYDHFKNIRIWSSDKIMFDTGVGPRHESFIQIDIYRIIFDHDFAKKLYGESSNEGFSYGLKDWEFHLQQMVASDNPIQYLGKSLGLLD